MTRTADPMPDINPIDRRHASGTGIACPVLSRRVGPWLPALYTWALLTGFAFLVPLENYRDEFGVSGMPLFLVLHEIIRFFIMIMMLGGLICGLPLGILWIIGMVRAIRRGWVRAGTVAVCAAVAALPVVLFLPMLMLLDYLTR